MELPRALKPWSTALSHFPGELALALGPWLPRLALAFGPLAPRGGAGGALPDGYDGLARRGPYERLSMGEWLLADELPEEFLRRAASGEHSFLRLAHREPRGTRRCLALFDAGPEQLGSPRIAQLATLIVLQRRAEAAGAELRWGVVQAPPTPLIDVTAEGYAALLHGRSAFDPTKEQLRAWLAALGEGECWRIGGPAFLGLAADAAGPTVEISDVLEPGARRVQLSIRRRAGSPPAALALELPSKVASGDLLRGAVSESRPRRPRPDGATLDERVASNVLLREHGRILYRNPSGALIVQHARRQHPPLTFQPEPGARVWAATWTGRRLVALVEREGQLRLHHQGSGKGKKGHWRRFGQLPDAPPAPPEDGNDPEPLRALHRLQTRNPEGLFWTTLDHQRRLLVLDERGQAQPPADWWVLASEGALHLATSHDASTCLVTVLPDGTVNTYPDGERARTYPSAVLGGVLGAPGRKWLEWAVLHEEGHWSLEGLEDSPPAKQLTPPAGSRVVGIRRDSKGLGTVLVLIEADQRTVSILGSRQGRRLWTAPSPIANLELGRSQPLAAVALENGDLHLFPLEDDLRMPFRFFPEDQPPLGKT